MISTAFNALKWIIDTLRDKKKSDSGRNEKKWNQLADYMDKVAELVEGCVSNFRKNGIPV